MSDSNIHATAIVDPAASLGAQVEIGPGAVIGPDVVLADRVRVGAYANLSGHTRIGEDTRIWPGAVIGEEPQDHHYHGEESYTEIGPRCKIREYATVHRGSQAGSTTSVGADCLLMGLSHVAHNCQVGDGVILANGALLAGHVTVGRRAFISGNSSIHQFVRIGQLAMIGGGSRVPRDVPPFFMLRGDALFRGINLVGMKRAGYQREAIREMQRLYDLWISDGEIFETKVERIRELAGTEPGLQLLEFLEGESKRGYQLST